MKTPVALLANYLKDINAQLDICRENFCDIEAVELEALHFKQAIELLQIYGFEKKGMNKRLRKLKVAKRKLYLKTLKNQAIKAAIKVN